MCAAGPEGPPVPALQAAHLRVGDVAGPARHADARVQAQDLPGPQGGAEPDASVVVVPPPGAPATGTCEVRGVQRFDDGPDERGQRRVVKRGGAVGGCGCAGQGGVQVLDGVFAVVELMRLAG